MLKLDFHNNWMPMTVLTLISALNVGVVIGVIAENTGVTGFVLNSMQITVLISLEFAGVIVAYVVSKRRNTTVPYSDCVSFAVSEPLSTGHQR